MNLIEFNVDKYSDMRYLNLLFILVLTSTVGCGGGSPSISIQPSIENFSESSPQNVKLDILWVVDPSRSMFEETENVKANISSFMEDIVAAGYEYRVGVISTAAWSDLAYQQDPVSKSFLVDSANRPVFNRLHSGECTDYAAAEGNLNPVDYIQSAAVTDVVDFTQKFIPFFDIYGAALGTSGCGLVGPPFGNYASVPSNFFEDPVFNTSERSVLGEYSNDERPLQSLEAFIQSSEGQDFTRDDAFLAVIVITDEPDGSRDDLTVSPSFDPQQPDLHEAQRYVDILNQAKGSTANYAVYSIIKQDGSNPLDENIASLTGGDTVDIDGDSAAYAAGLASIQQSIIEESSLYLLDSDPIINTIKVTLIKASTGEVLQVPADTGSGGFVYVAGVNGIKFTPPFIIETGDNLSVVYDKTSLGSGSSGSPPAMTLSNNTVSESAPNGQLVGRLSVSNIDDVTGLTYSLDSDTSNGGFSVSANGEVRVTDSGLLDRETLPLHTLEVTASGSGNFEFTSDNLIILTDAIDAIPVAANDQYIVSEASANGAGNITVVGNVSSNDLGIDSSENHTFQITSTPANGSGTLNNSGLFNFIVNRTDLNLSSGQQALLDFQYTISDSSGNTSSPAQIRVIVQGLNEAPVNDLIISDVTATGGGTIPEVVNLIAEANSGLAAGDLDDATDGNAGTGFVTSALANQAHFVTYEMEDLGEAGDELYQVTSVSFDGAHSMGNTVIQVLSEQDQVLSREVLSITTGDQTGVVGFSTPAIGRKIKLIRPSGAVNSDLDDDLQVNEIVVNGILADIIRINLDDHFTDPDDPNPGALTYYATDVNGEGPAPGWANINSSELVLVPPAGTDTDIGIVAEDASGATAFVTFNVTRAGGSSLNAGPIALLAIDDTQRGGLTLKRYGGYSDNNCGSSSTLLTNNSDQYITWDEGDDFIDQLLDENGDFIYPSSFDANTNMENLSNPRGLPAPYYNDGHGTPENGWNPIPSNTIDKYSDNGAIRPLNDSERCYGETYTGYFVPDRTGLYRFRTDELDDIVRLLVSTGEYTSELTNVITGTIDTGTMRDVTAESTNSGNLFLGSNAQVDGPLNEFFPTANQGGEGTLGSGHDTSIFFTGGIPGYQPGYTYLEEGNVYTFQIRFMEGGGSQRFNFEFDYREDGSGAGSWDDAWRPIDGIVTVPFGGTEGYSPQVVTSQPFVAFDSSDLFYDAELDVLEYAVQMVNADGTAYLGPGGTSNVGEIGLSYNSTTGLLSGSLNATYNNASTKPRVRFTASERFTTAQQSVRSLPIKFD